MERRNVGILGATGMVGQRFIQLLENHPWFNITWLAASDRSAGKTYADACKWKLDTPLPAHIAQMVLQPNLPELATGELPRIIFAALDADIARELEPKFAEAGCAVISNSSAFRMTADAGYVIGPPGLGLLADATSSTVAIISASVVLVSLGAIFAFTSPEKRSVLQP